MALVIVTSRVYSQSYAQAKKRRTPVQPGVCSRELQDELVNCTSL